MNQDKKRKLSLLLAVASMMLCGVAEAKLPGEVEIKFEQLLKALRPATRPSAYGVAEYGKDLKELAAQARSVDQTSLFAQATAQERAIVTLALAIEDPRTADRVQELAIWYGQYVHELPDKYFQERAKNASAAARALGREEKSLEELREQMRQGSASDNAKAIPYRPPVARLRDEHTKPEYLNAWAFWLMSPPSKERNFMAGKINKALEKIAEESMIPLVVEALKFDTARAERDVKRGAALAYINLICGMPGEKAVNALLEINRYAIENGLNGDDYFKSITRHIVRRLASRRAYADQLVDPKMKEIIARQGYNEKAEDIPLTDELWKTYKPLVAARLEARTARTPRADVELLQAADAIMPSAK